MHLLHCWHSGKSDTSTDPHSSAVKFHLLLIFNHFTVHFLHWWHSDRSDTGTDPPDPHSSAVKILLLLTLSLHCALFYPTGGPRDVPERWFCPQHQEMLHHSSFSWGFRRDPWPCRAPGWLYPLGQGISSFLNPWSRILEQRTGLNWIFVRKNQHRVKTGAAGEGEGARRETNLHPIPERGKSSSLRKSTRAAQSSRRGGKAGILSPC